MDLSLTILVVPRLVLSLLSALLIRLSSSTLKDPTGILEGTTGLVSASCSSCLACAGQDILMTLLSIHVTKLLFMLLLH